MGEKIKTLALGRLLNAGFEIELNQPTVSEEDQQIHIHIQGVRFELDKKEYIKFATSVLVAEKNLKKLKNIE